MKLLQTLIINTERANKLRNDINKMTHELKALDFSNDVLREIINSNSGEVFENNNDDNEDE